MSKTAKNIEKLIQLGKFNKEDIMNKLDIFLLADRISSEEYNHLVEMLEMLEVGE